MQPASHYSDPEVGPRFALIRQICKRLYNIDNLVGPDDRVDPPRMAPSIITRSECELFCLSTPRFARRVYLHVPSGVRERTVLINVRRLSWFHAAFANRWKIDAGVNEQLKKDIVKEGQPIADSLFIVPAELEEDYHVLTCDLAHYYGETWLDLGVPFMQHMQVGGGMCAQACIFMALCLQERWAAAITGVAELTILAKQKSRRQTDSLPLKGLSQLEISDVLSSKELGLNGPLECPKRRADRDPSPLGQAPMEILVEAAWHAYIESGIPVICILDAHKVAGVNLAHRDYDDGCIWGLNGVDKIEETPPEKDGPHAVLLVGAHRKNGREHATGGFEGNSQFLINDPACSPLMKAPYRMLTGAALRDQLEWIPVLPAGVKYSLLPAEPESLPVNMGGHSHVKTRGHGLLEAAWERQVSDMRVPYTARWTGPHPGRVRLLHREAGDWRDQMKSIAKFDVRSAHGEPDERSAQLGQRVNEFLEAIDPGQHRWLWIQVLGLDVAEPTLIQFWIWDAGKDYVADPKANPVLLVLESPNGTMLFERYSRPLKADHGDQAP